MGSDRPRVPQACPLWPSTSIVAVTVVWGIISPTWMPPSESEHETLQTHQSGLIGALRRVLILHGQHGMGRGQGASERVVG